MEYSQEVWETAKEEIDILELLQNFSPDIVNKGGRLYVRCLNPAHNDNRPSMLINTMSNRGYSNFLYCFSCNCRMNTIEVVKHYNNCNAVEALEFLINQYPHVFSRFDLADKNKTPVKRDYWKGISEKEFKELNISKKIYFFSNDKEDYLEMKELFKKDKELYLNIVEKAIVERRTFLSKLRETAKTSEEIEFLDKKLDNLVKINRKKDIGY